MIDNLQKERKRCTLKHIRTDCFMILKNNTAQSDQYQKYIGTIKNQMKKSTFIRCDIIVNSPILSSRVYWVVGFSLGAPVSPTPAHIQ
jgi:hypothetical protein